VVGRHAASARRLIFRLFAASANRNIGELATAAPVRALVLLRVFSLPFRLPSPAFAASAGLALLTAGCTSVNRLAVNQLGNALAGGGAVFASDSDPELVRDAAPFSLKLMESLLAETPRHSGLLTAAAAGFTQYAYAFVQQDADRLEGTDIAAAVALRARARGLYLRGRDYGLRGLDVAHPDFARRLRTVPAEAVQACTAGDVPLLYWTAAAWAAAITNAKNDPGLIADLPLVEALIDRARALDDTFDDGAIPTFLITYEQARSSGTGPADERSRAHFDRAVALGGGRQAAPFVAYAEAVCLPRQDRTQFEQLLRRALAIDPDAHPPARLANLVLQTRARRLLEQIDELFLPAEPAT
jgi:predicted anti-sigma-YlaC factor YlaD